MPDRRLLSLCAVAALVASACVPMMPTTPTTADNKKKPGSNSEASPQPTARPLGDTSLAAGYTGQVLGLDGLPAANVTVRSYVIAAGGGNVIAAGGGNVIAAGGGNVIAAGGGNVIAAGGGNYRLLAAPTEVKTDEQGRFKLEFPADSHLNIEAVLKDDIKAIQLDVAKGADALKLKLAKTGTITGKVTAPDAPTVKDFEGVDVYIPGTGYAAKTDKDGRFTIANVPVGTFNLVATKTGLGRANLIGLKVESEKTAATPDLPLSVKAPVVAKVEPAIVGPGAELAITGENFGATEGKTFQVTVGGVVVTEPTRVDDKTIKLKVPASAGNGDVAVTVDGIQSNGAGIKVLKALTIVAEVPICLKGKPYAYSLKGTDTAGNALDAAPASWETAASEVVFDAAAKTFTPQKTGKLTLKASNGTIPATLEIEAFASLYMVSTLAGNGQVQSKDGKGAAAQFGSVEGLAADGQGNLYVAEPPRLRKVTPDGTVTTVYDGGADNIQPRRVCVDKNGGVFFTAYSDNFQGPQAVYKLAGDGSATRVAGTGTYGSGDDADPLKATFNQPKLITADANNNLFVTTDNGMAPPTSVLRRIGSDGVTTWSSAIAWPNQTPGIREASALATTTDGSVLMAGTRDQVMTASYLYRIAPDKTASLIAGGGIGIGTERDGTGAAASLGVVRGMAVDAQGNFYVADEEAGSMRHYYMRMVTPAGVVTTLAGSAQTGEAVDGAGPLAILGSFGGLAMAPDGTIYVADNSHYRLRKLVKVNAP